MPKEDGSPNVEERDRAVAYFRQMAAQARSLNPHACSADWYDMAVAALTDQDNAPTPQMVVTEPNFSGVGEGQTVTDEQLAQWERLCNDATAGPWQMVDYNAERPWADTWLGVIRGAFEIATPRYEIGHVQYSALPHAENVANARLIAMAREALPALIAQVRALRGTR